MKNAYLAALALVGTAAYANTVETVFKNDTLLPPELKARVLAAVEEQCAHVLTAYGLRELHTDATPTSFVTTFQSHHYDSDGYHPATSTFVAEAHSDAGVEVDCR